MARRSPLDFDISVTADKRRRARVRGMTGAFESSTRICEHPGCEARGAYRAPRAPEQVDEYLWFCLDHVREYNQRWNFFQDYSAEEFEAEMESSRLWGRPTWKLGAAPRKPANGHAEGEAWRRFGFSDPLEVLGANATINPGQGQTATAPMRRRALPGNERRALDILGARDDMGRAELRRLYRDLVKSLHPDLNGGTREAEGQLRDVVWAWDQIRGSRNFAD